MTTNELIKRDNDMQSEILHAIGKFKLIESGTVTRGRRKNKKDWEPGTRPLTMADAKAIAGLAAQRLSAVLTAYMDTTPKYLDFNKDQPISIHLEPSEFASWPSEKCVDCQVPTRYWTPDKLTPLCPSCCQKRNETMVSKK